MPLKPAYHNRNMHNHGGLLHRILALLQHIFLSFAHFVSEKLATRARRAIFGVVFLLSLIILLRVRGTGLNNNNVGSTTINGEYVFIGGGSSNINDNNNNNNNNNDNNNNNNARRYGGAADGSKDSCVDAYARTLEQQASVPFVPVSSSHGTVRLPLVGNGHIMANVHDRTLYLNNNFNNRKKHTMETAIKMPWMFPRIAGIDRSTELTLIDGKSGTVRRIARLSSSSSNSRDSSRGGGGGKGGHSIRNNCVLVEQRFFVHQESGAVVADTLFHSRSATSSSSISVNFETTTSVPMPQELQSRALPGLAVYNFSRRDGGNGGGAEESSFQMLLRGGGGGGGSKALSAAADESTVAAGPPPPPPRNAKGWVGQLNGMNIAVVAQSLVPPSTNMTLMPEESYNNRAMRHITVVVATGDTSRDGSSQKGGGGDDGDKMERSAQSVQQQQHERHILLLSQAVTVYDAVVATSGAVFGGRRDLLFGSHETAWHTRRPLHMTVTGDAALRQSITLGLYYLQIAIPAAANGITEQALTDKAHYYYGYNNGGNGDVSATGYVSGGGCYHGPLTRYDNTMWQPPPDYDGLFTFVEHWQTTFSTAECDGTHTVHNALAAAVLSVAGIGWQGNVLKLAPSWDLRSDTVLTVWPLRLLGHELSARFTRQGVTMKRAEANTGPIFVSNNGHEPILLGAEDEQTVPANVIYVADNVERILAHEASDDKLSHVPARRNERLPAAVVFFAVLAVVGFHVCLIGVIYTEYCRK